MVQKPNVKAKQPKAPLSIGKLLCLTAIAALLLLVSNSAIWFNRNIFNSQQFTDTATTALLNESSRDAMASQVTDKLLADKPIAKKLLDDKATKLISALLDTSQSRTAFQKTIGFLHTTITSKDPQPISLDLTGVKDVMGRVITITSQATGNTSEDRRINPEDLPDEIVIFDPAKLPNIYTIGTTMMWLGPLAFVGAIAIFSYIIGRSRKVKSDLAKALSVVGLTCIVTGFIAQLIGPLIKPAILGQIANQNARTVTANLYDAFMGLFTNQTNVMFLIGIVVLLIAGWVYFDVFSGMKKLSAQQATKKTNPAKSK